MKDSASRCLPGQVRDEIVRALRESHDALSAKQIEASVSARLGTVSGSSVRSYLRLNTPDVFVRESRGMYCLRERQTTLLSQPARADAAWRAPFVSGMARLVHGDCFTWLRAQEDLSIHAVVTDPPYGLHEYTEEQQEKLHAGKGGVWRVPPSFDGNKRAPLPRFTTLTPAQLRDLREFFHVWARTLLPKLLPGANVIVASNPLLSYIVSGALADAGLERRGEVIRLVMTMRGGDRPKAAHEEFAGVSVMPRSMWEPWLVYRKPVEGRVQDNLRKWKTGGFRRPSPDRPFGDVVRSAPTHKSERQIAPHPSLKPQAFMRHMVRAALPLGEGTVLDPFAGAGSTLAAAEAVGYASIGVEKDERYFLMAREAIPRLAALWAREERQAR